MVQARGRASSSTLQSGYVCLRLLAFVKSLIRPGPTCSHITLKGSTSAHHLDCPASNMLSISFVCMSRIYVIHNFCVFANMIRVTRTLTDPPCPNRVSNVTENSLETYTQDQEQLFVHKTVWMRVKTSITAPPFVTQVCRHRPSSVVGSARLKFDTQKRSCSARISSWILSRELYSKTRTTCGGDGGY